MADDQLDGYKALVDQCLSEYDLDGWQVPDLASFDELGKAGPGSSACPRPVDDVGRPGVLPPVGFGAPERVSPAANAQRAVR